MLATVTDEGALALLDVAQVGPLLAWLHHTALHCVVVVGMHEA